jgi:hypothetical protein
MKSRRTNWADPTAEPLAESGQAAYDDEARRAMPVETKQRIKPAGSVSDLVAEQRR